MAEGEINIDNIIQRLLEGKISPSLIQILTLGSVFHGLKVERCWFPFLCVTEVSKYLFDMEFFVFSERKQTRQDSPDD